MQSCPTLKRWLAAAVTAVVFVGIGLASTLSGGAGAQGKAAGVKAGLEEWVMYGGSLSRNMVNPIAKGLPETWNTGANGDKPENIKWKASLGSKAYGGPIVHGGKVYIGTNNQQPRDKKYIDPKGKPIDLGVLMAFDQDNGKFLWQTIFRKLPSGLVNDWPLEGLCSTPVVEGDRMYYVSNRCEVVCSDTSGDVKWKLDMMGKLGVFPHNISACSPLVVGDDLFVVTANGVDEGHINVPAPKAPSFIRVNKKTGEVLWQDNRPTKTLLEIPRKGDQKAFFKQLVNEGRLIQHGQWSNPSYGIVNGKPQVIFPGGDGWIYSFDPKIGKLIWRFDCNPKDSKYELGGKGTRSDFIATPVVYANRVYIATGQDPEHETGVGHLWCIDMTKEGDVSPEVVTDDTVFPPKTRPNPNSAAVWHYGGPAPKKGGRNYVFGRTMSTCAIHDGLVYAAELGGYLHCLDAKTGQKYWEHDLGAMAWSSPYYADGKVYMGTDAGIVTVFAHGKQKRILAENDVGGRVRATPVAINGTLFVMTENELYAIGKK